MNSNELDAGMAQLCERLRVAERVTVMTGAGVSAASGVPTFRGDGGLWRAHRAEELATPQAFARDPELVWEFYQWRRQLVRRCEPNRAHEVLAEWSERWPAFTLVTQNVDGLHERAGTRGLVRLHGSLREVRCFENCPQSPPRWVDESEAFPQLPPPCPHCGGLLRPGVVWFGESLNARDIRSATQAANCEVFLTIGTSAQVMPAAGFVHLAAEQGAFTVEINPESTPSTAHLDLALAGPAEVVLDRLAARLQDS